MDTSGRGRKSDQDRLLEALPADGAFRTSREVRDELKLTEARYRAIRDRLVDEGKITKSRGRDGTIALRVAAKEEKLNPRVEQRETVKKVTEEIQEESRLHGPVAKSIEQRAKDEEAENRVVEITARQGRRQTGGEWSRPDDQEGDPDPPSDEGTEGDAEIESAGISFMVTQQQKAKLRELGYSDEEIRNMKPEEAHRALGLIS